MNENKTTTLIIARHGNTFEAGETPRRVGLRTDLPLTEKGREQARAIGRYLKEHGLSPDAIFTSHLKRAEDTAVIAKIEAGSSAEIQKDTLFNEIDYGPDENKEEADVIARIGEKALKNWDEKALPPPGWDVDPQALIKGWQDFAADMTTRYPGCNILITTSNGIARFAPHLTGDFDGFCKDHKIKIATGALCILEHDDNGWRVMEWNLRPSK